MSTDLTRWVPLAAMAEVQQVQPLSMSWCLDRRVTKSEAENGRKWSERRKREKEQMPRVGEPAVPFKLPDVNGRLYSLGQYRGHWLLMVFHRHLG